jgi:hypothetical protein
VVLLLLMDHKGVEVDLMVLAFLVLVVVIPVAEE